MSNKYLVGKSAKKTPIHRIKKRLLKYLKHTRKKKVLTIRRIDVYKGTEKQRVKYLCKGMAEQILEGIVKGKETMRLWRSMIADAL